MIGDQIYEVRSRAGLTQEEFGRRLGISRAVVAQYERNRCCPSVDVVILICETFGVSGDWLLELSAERAAWAMR